MADDSSDKDPAGGQVPAPGIREDVRTSAQSEPGRPDWSQRLRAQSNKLAFVCVVAAIVGFATYAHGIHPLGDWLTFYWARAWLWVALFGFASLASGLTVLARLKVHGGGIVERTNIALALGVLTFALGIFVVGLFGLLGLPFFLAWPVLQLLLGRRALLRYFRVLARLWSKFGPALFFPQSPIQALAVLGIVAGAFAIYVQVLAPANVGFDARFYHVPLAEGYAAAGRIRALPEGWYLGAYPQLASWLYTWAFLAPGVLKHHLCLASHLEFALVLLTVSNTSALASRLISGARLRHGGVALFLFPAIFNVSSNLSLGADHALAFWAAPLGLALLRYLTNPSVRQGALLGILVGGATLTKYQAIFMVVPIAMVLAVNLSRDRQFRPLLIAAGAAVVVASPFWLKNAIAYGDPFYPNLYRWLPDHPFFPGAGDRLAKVFYSGGPDPSLPGMQKLRDTLLALVDYSFHPLGFAMAPDSSTVVGSLFTLLLPLMLWVRPRWRVLLLVGCVHVALALWWRTLPASRYLQAFMPWMAACVAAALAAAWRTQIHGLAWCGRDPGWLADHLGWRHVSDPIPRNAGRFAASRRGHPGRRASIPSKRVPRGAALGDRCTVAQTGAARRARFLSVDRSRRSDDQRQPRLAGRHRLLADRSTRAGAASLAGPRWNSSALAVQQRGPFAGGLGSRHGLRSCQRCIHGFVLLSRRLPSGGDRQSPGTGEHAEPHLARVARLRNRTQPRCLHSGRVRQRHTRKAARPRPAEE